jgi:hypothetical protein
MKGVLSAVAIITGLIGVASLFLGLFTWNLVGFLFGGFGLLCAYAWSVVAELWEKVENLESEIHKTTA